MHMCSIPNDAKHALTRYMSYLSFANPLLSCSQWCEKTSQDLLKNRYEFGVHVYICNKAKLM